MKKKVLLLSTVALAALGSTAMAADLVPITKAPPPVAAPASDWSGFYLGAHGGWGWADTVVDNPFSLTGVVFTPLFAAPKGSGWLAGGHFGYNWQYGNVVAGLEADLDVADINDKQTISGGGASATLTSTFDMLATARARLGWAPTPWLMLYGTGGAAWGHSSVDFSATVPAGVLALGPVTLGQSANTNQFGWVGGAGVESKLGDHWMLRAEYLHYDFAKAGINFPVQNAGPIFFNTNAQSTVDVVRAGVGFKF